MTIYEIVQQKSELIILGNHTYGKNLFK